MGITFFVFGVFLTVLGSLFIRKGGDKSSKLLIMYISDVAI